MDCNHYHWDFIKEMLHDYHVLPVIRISIERINCWMLKTVAKAFNHGREARFRNMACHVRVEARWFDSFFGNFRVGVRIF